ncbi:MAG: hypothetical protein GY820_17050 [Gammaproteobacteria bacterium]|nr:hypothetical protein [Gammaproteobacteria bacterium]
MLKNLLGFGSPSLFFMEGDAGDGAGGGGGGGEDKTWHEALPEDIRADASLVDFKDESEMVNMPVNVARSYINTKKMVGRDKIPMPKSDEEFMAVYDRLGRPKEATEYSTAIPESITDEKLKENLTTQLEWFKGIAHSAGLNDTQATAIFKAFAESGDKQMGEMQTNAENQFREAEIALRTEYGNSFEGKMVLMNRAIDSLDQGTDIKALLDSTGLSRHPAIIKTFVRMGEFMAEDLGIDKTTGEIADTPESLKDQKDELMKSPAYLDAKDPAHDTTVRKVAALIEKISGSQKVEPTNRMTFLN